MNELQPFKVLSLLCCDPQLWLLELALVMVEGWEDEQPCFNRLKLQKCRAAREAHKQGGGSDSGDQGFELRPGAPCADRVASVPGSATA